MTTPTTVAYKGRSYRCLFLGETRFGRRAKLAFADGSKEFWVDAALVSNASAPQRSSGANATRNTYRRKYGWDGVVGSSSYYSSGLYDEES